ncbi:tetratricopeptide repeat protein [Neolewinella persica]|uniref:tetratricopeptide repeat protein n=1 Tax=Neolewinella persica TaxID=70998 RepID=UPI00037EC26C|nr:tetratricopeptide repeat protein [Neolewinella persica]
MTFQPTTLPGLRANCIICLLLVFSACGGPRTTTSAELPYKKLIHNAEVETLAGNYLAAAENYRKAYDQKPRKKEILFKAAELFDRVRDYKKAANAYQFLEADDQRWPLLGLQYGRALKQDGRYEQARRQLGLFIESYNGADRAIVKEIVNNELMGLRLAQEDVSVPGAVDIDRPGRGVNTSADEFGPVAIAGDQLFFTSTAGGQSRLYQSRLQAKEWTKATVPPGFPVIAEGEFGTGSFSADGQVFFFTICSGLTGEDATNRCEIFRGSRNASGIWSQPERLNAEVNQPGSTNTFPSVFIGSDGLAVLYFASDRPGGKGGMDIYVSTQIRAEDPTTFAVARPLSRTINTVSDEVTPFYDLESGVLYFASNGHPGFGGLDVFRSAVDGLGDFQRPENLGRPVNSSADDYGLSLAAGTGRGYLTSNRSFDEVKFNTTETDIYTLNFRAGRARLKAMVYDNTTGSELGGAEVTLLELMPDGRVTELEKRTFPTGIYDFNLQPGSNYQVVIRREGYQGAEYQVETSEAGSSLYGQPVFLLRNAIQNSTGQGARPQVQGGGNQQELPPPPTVPAGNGSRPDPGLVGPPPAPASAPKNVAPVAYRIQISASRDFVAEDGRYERVRAIGNLQAEPIPGKQLQRITVGYFTDAAAAKKALAFVQSNGFPSAFAVRYDDGQRHGLVRL